MLRLQNVYGPGQSLTNPYTGIVLLFSQLAREGRSIPLYEDGEITRDFVYITDVRRALAAALAQPPADGRRARVDIGTGVAHHDPATSPRPSRDYHGAPARSSPDSSATATCATPRARWTPRARSSAGAPQVTMAEGVALLQEWIADQKG